MSKVAIILTDWMGYPLYRRKKIKNRVFKCGVGRMLKNMSIYPAGVEFSLSLVINQDDSPMPQNSLIKRCWQKMPNTQQAYVELTEVYPFIQSVVFRANQGMDIGAYDYGLGLLRQSDHQGDVLFLNSSVAHSLSVGWLKKYHDLFYQEANTGLCGVTLNSHNTCYQDAPFDPHVQSFFLYSNTEVLDNVFPDGLCGADSEHATDKHGLIFDGEIGISRKILEAGYAIRSSFFPEFVYRKGGEWLVPTGDLRFNRQYNKQANSM